MSGVIFLDSGPLGLLTHPQRSSEVVSLADWLSECLERRRKIIVPAIVYYEIRREMLRAHKLVSLGRLDAFVESYPGRYLPLSDEALRLASQLWAKTRQQGKPTADATALDIDVIIAAQALCFSNGGSGVTVATMNGRHFAHFVDAKHWNQIAP